MATDFEIVSRIDLALSVVTLALLVALLITYIKLYRQLRQKFTIGFIIFTSLFLLHNLPATIFQAVRTFGLSPEHVGPPRGFDADPGAFVYLRVIPSVFELVAVGVLLWLARE